MELKDSRTKENLLRAFAGESQARNRYEFAAEVAKREGWQIIHDLFKYTADQEKAHARVYYDALKQFRDSQHNEREEWSNIYSDFAEIAKNEGFEPISKLFSMVASVEKEHDDRFTKYINELENGTIYKRDQPIKWMCTNCGYIYEGKEPPLICPVCSYPQGYYMDFTMTQYE